MRRPAVTEPMIFPNPSRRDGKVSTGGGGVS